MLELDLPIFVKVHRNQTKGCSWNRAMDEVQLERMIQKYKDSGELDSEDPALVMLKQWPASKQYKDNHDKLRGLEQKVCIFTGLAGPQYSGRCKIFLLLFFYAICENNVWNIFCR